MKRMTELNYFVGAEPYDNAAPATCTPEAPEAPDPIAAAPV
jgi:hypothetical protein